MLSSLLVVVLVLLLLLQMLSLQLFGPKDGKESQLTSSMPYSKACGEILGMLSVFLANHLGYGHLA